MEPEVRRAWDKSESEVQRAYGRVWERKPLLRRIYHNWYDTIIERLRPGLTLEVGAGIGTFRSHFRRPCISIDVLAGSAVDLLADGQALPFRTAAFANALCVDVVHHVGAPRKLFREIARVLEPGGRFVFVEPYVSPLSRVVRRLFHPEAGERGYTSAAGEKSEALSGEIEGPTRLFAAGASPADLSEGLRLKECRFMSMFLYPLSGGFTYRRLLPRPVEPFVASLERFVPLGRLCGFKMLVVLERTAAS